MKRRTFAGAAFTGLGVTGLFGKPQKMKAGLSFEKTALPIAIEMGIGIQAIKVFCKAFLLRSLSPTECLRYTLSQPVHVAICGAGTQGQMEDNIRTVQSMKKFTAEEIANVRRRAAVGQDVYTATTMEYWKKKQA